MAKRTHAFDIVLFPPKEIAQKALAVSRILKKRGGLFVLDGVDYFPHVTVYAAEFSERNMPKIKTILEKLALQTRPFKMTSLHYRQEERGYVVADYRKSKSVQELREKIISAVHSFCEAHKNKKESARCRVAEEFVPHITFTKFLRYTPRALSGIKELDFSFRADAIGLYYLGEYGTCRKLVRSFNLSNKKIVNDLL